MGVLTEGRPTVSEIIAAPLTNFNKTLVLALAASANSEIDHPIAKALTAKAEELGVTIIPPTWASAQRGRGITAVVDGVSVTVGNGRLFAEALIKIDALATLSEKYLRAGDTVLFVAADGVPAGFVVLKDELHPEAEAAIAALHKAGITVIMLTGDNDAASRSLASRLGIARLHAEVGPKQESVIIQKLKAAGRLIAVLGRSAIDHHLLAAAHTTAVLGDKKAQHASDLHQRVKHIGEFVALLLAARFVSKRLKIAGSHTFFAIITGLLVGLVTGIIFSVLLPDPAAIAIGAFNGLGAFLLAR